jgi:hypothetical protein
MLRVCRILQMLRIQGLVAVAGRVSVQRVEPVPVPTGCPLLLRRFAAAATALQREAGGKFVGFFRKPFFSKGEMSSIFRISDGFSAEFLGSFSHSQKVNRAL